jgi:hypothetical protein
MNHHPHRRTEPRRSHLRRARTLSLALAGGSVVGVVALADLASGTHHTSARTPATTATVAPTYSAPVASAAPSGPRSGAS